MEEEANTQGKVGEVKLGAPNDQSGGGQEAQAAPQPGWRTKASG